MDAIILRLRNIFESHINRKSYYRCESIFVEKDYPHYGYIDAEAVLIIIKLESFKRII